MAYTCVYSLLSCKDVARRTSVILDEHRDAITRHLGRAAGFDLTRPSTLPSLAALCPKRYI
jgi:hypothetical protein